MVTYPSCIFELSWQFVFKVGMYIVWRDVETDSEELEQIRKEVSVLLRGLVVAPINLPGFYFHKALKVCSPGAFFSFLSHAEH